MSAIRVELDSVLDLLPEQQLADVLDFVRYRSQHVPSATQQDKSDGSSLHPPEDWRYWTSRSEAARIERGEDVTKSVPLVAANARTEPWVWTPEWQQRLDDADAAGSGIIAYSDAEFDAILDHWSQQHNAADI